MVRKMLILTVIMPNLPIQQCVALSHLMLLYFQKKAIRKAIETLDVLKVVITRDYT